MDCREKRGWRRAGWFDMLCLFEPGSEPFRKMQEAIKRMDKVKP